MSFYASPKSLFALVLALGALLALMSTSRFFTSRPVLLWELVAVELTLVLLALYRAAHGELAPPVTALQRIKNARVAVIVYSLLSILNMIYLMANHDSQLAFLTFILALFVVPLSLMALRKEQKKL